MLDSKPNGALRRCSNPRTASCSGPHEVEPQPTALDEKVSVDIRDGTYGCGGLRTASALQLNSRGTNAALLVPYKESLARQRIEHLPMDLRYL